MPDILKDALLKEYGEVANNFRTLTDIRFRMIGYLPIASGAAVLVTSLSGQTSPATIALLALFGLAATAGIATYNVRNDQLYDELVGRAAAIERKLGLADGQFANRPRNWLTLRILGMRWSVGHRQALATIYAASFALWLTVLLGVTLDFARRFDLHVDRGCPSGNHSCAFLNAFALLTAVVVTLAGASLIRVQQDAQQRKLRRLAGQAYAIARALGARRALANCEFVETCAALAGETTDNTWARAEFYRRADLATLRYYLPADPESERAAVLVALLTDFPPQWIFDTGENRKGTVGAAERRQWRVATEVALLKGRLRTLCDRLGVRIASR